MNQPNYAALKDFKRDIEIYRDFFWEFYEKQEPRVQKKIDWVITLVQTTRVVPQKFFKHLTDTDGLWEIRVSAGGGIFRVFCFFDEGNLVVLLGGFQKKSQKTPTGEIKKAERLKKEYFNKKR